MNKKMFGFINAILITIGLAYAIYFAYSGFWFMAILAIAYCIYEYKTSQEKWKQL